MIDKRTIYTNNDNEDFEVKRSNPEQRVIRMANATNGLYLDKDEIDYFIAILQEVKKDL